MNEFWEAQFEGLKRRAAAFDTAVRELEDCRRQVALLQEMLKQAEECKSILRDERDTARLDLVAITRERDEWKSRCERAHKIASLTLAQLGQEQE